MSSAQLSVLASPAVTSYQASTRPIGLFELFARLEERHPLNVMVLTFLTDTKLA
jgi:hypothetical protein